MDVKHKLNFGAKAVFISRMKSLKYIIGYLGLVLLLMMLLFSGCARDKIKIIVASKPNTEGAILSQLIIQRLRSEELNDELYNKYGFRLEVIDKTWMGTTEDLREAIKNGDIDIYPEYTGNVLKFYGLFDDNGELKKREELLDDKGELKYELPFVFLDNDNLNYSIEKKGEKVVGEVFELSFDLQNENIEKKINKLLEDINKIEDTQKMGVEWLQPAKADNAWAIAIRQDVAEEIGIETVERFAEHVNNDENDVKVYGSKEFFSSVVGLPLFESKYRFSLRDDQKIIVSSPIYAEHLVAEGPHNGKTLYAAMAYKTDGYLIDAPLLVLEDNLRAQPLYLPAPVVRKEILKEFNDKKANRWLEAKLEAIFSLLDQKTLQRLNKQAVEGRKFPSDVAREFLMENGIDASDKKYAQFPSDRPTPGLFDPKKDKKGKVIEKIIELVNTEITVESTTMWEEEFYVNEEFMSDVRIVGWCMASGGPFDNIEMLLLNDINFSNWKNFHKLKDPIYQSEKITKEQISLEIKKGTGSYHLVISNRFSEFSSKEVLVKAYLYYQSFYNPASGPVGTLITVSIPGWVAGELIDSVTVGGKAATHALTVDGGGNLSGTITVPEGLAPDTYSIAITGATRGEQTFTDAFEVTA
jgi:osmoprotectant transport system substrate-binding protein